MSERDGIMVRVLRSVLACVVIIGLALAIPAPTVQACGPFFPVTMFIQRIHPDVPLETYAAGALGVIQPGYSLTFQIVAYRYLSGVPLDAGEQAAFASYWKQRYQPDEQWTEQERSRNAGFDEWMKVRATVPQLDTPPYAYKAGSNFIAMYDANWCLNDAFQTAAATLTARTREFGAGAPAVASWVHAQDQVFANCKGLYAPEIKDKRARPEAATADLPAVIRADRAYQSAAAAFYGTAWSEAEAQFEAVANDAASPWKDVAKLVAIRCLIRQATTEQDAEKAQPLLKEAYARLQKFLADPSLAALHPSAKRLEGFVLLRSEPAKRLAELNQILEKKSTPETLGLPLYDYTYLLENAEGSKTAHSAGDMTDWITTFQSQRTEAAKHALERWEATHTLPWLLAALASTNGASTSAKLLEAASNVPAASPGYLTAAFHRARLLTEAGRNDEARAQVDAVLKNASPKLPYSARNLFTALAMKLSRTLEEFARYAPRQASFVAIDPDGRDFPSQESCDNASSGWKTTCEHWRLPPALFDTDAATVLTEVMPTKMMAEVATKNEWSAGLRLAVTQAAWVKAVLLADDALSLRLAEKLGAMDSSLAEGFKTYAAAKSPEQRQFAAVFLLLHRPDMHPFVDAGIGRQTLPGRIDNFRDNWWCTTKQGQKSPGNERFEIYGALNAPMRYVYPDGKVAAPSFLTEDERRDGAGEWSAIAALDAAPSWMGAQALAWAKTHPDDPRVPEALHLVVRATRYGCTSDTNGKYSKAAFELLHKRYAESDWTKKTPLWFK